ncbi:hypothetical protein SAMN06265337_3656 [Hymenobacter gelipurpurascens]|uniref:Uncharacterized protein n=1 Tax=Hymenobacter gelipurpurascens TaxID=89968 RepID=A0A212UFF3_9BACT|nr:hypothetical protein [Hymenobacter gelipurpurascens]SNC76975.1 hypothetical protein SAMN06265337_3656 [Hymenobacter gelipurpurascens]
MLISQNPLSHLPLRASLVALTIGLGACATPHPLTRSNELQHTMTTTFYNRQLNTSLLLNGDYDLELHPKNKPDDVTKARLKQLGLSRRQSAVLFTGQTNLTPTYRLRSLRITGNPNWRALGFQENGTGRFQHTGTVGADLLMEYAAPLPDNQGWLYLIATDEASSRADTSIKDRSYEMDAEFVTFTFPSVQQGRWPRVVSPVRLANDAFLSRPNGDYLAPLSALAQSRHAPSAGNDPSIDGMLWQMLQQYHAMAGNTDSVEYFQQQGWNNVRIPAPISPTDTTHRPNSAPTDTLVSVDAVPEILRKTAGVQVVMLNESHTFGRHRALAAALLPGLYQQGFRYLALETLEDTAANTLNPLPLKAGFYTREATYANMIRTARRMGFTLVAYEATRDQKERELGEATNLYNAVRHDPAAKVFVYGGGAHINRLVMPSQVDKKWMAQQLIDLTGWRILSVNQARMSNEARSGLAAVPIGTAQVVYQLRKGKRLSPYPENDLVVRNNLDLAQLPLPYSDATNAQPVSLDVRPFKPTATTGRRMLQLYLQSELAVREDISPVYTHELRPSDDVLAIHLVPGRYVYRVLSEKLKEEKREELMVR